MRSLQVGWLVTIITTLTKRLQTPTTRRLHTPQEQLNQLEADLAGYRNNMPLGFTDPATGGTEVLRLLADWVAHSNCKTPNKAGPRL